jgi:uncharacterized protein
MTGEQKTKMVAVVEDDESYRIAMNRLLKSAGLPAVIGRTQRIVGYGLAFELNHILIGQSGLALSLDNAARKGTQSLDEHLATVCTLRDGKICEINTYLSDVEMVNAFFVCRDGAGSLVVRRDGTKGLDC